MKTKTLSLAMIILASMALVGCGSNSTNANPPATTNSMSSQPTPGSTMTNNPAGANH